MAWGLSYLLPGPGCMEGLCIAGRSPQLLCLTWSCPERHMTLVRCLTTTGSTQETRARSIYSRVPQRNILPFPLLSWVWQSQAPVPASDASSVCNPPPTPLQRQGTRGHRLGSPVKAEETYGMGARRAGPLSQTLGRPNRERAGRAAERWRQEEPQAATGQWGPGRAPGLRAGGGETSCLPAPGTGLNSVQRPKMHVQNPGILGVPRKGGGCRAPWQLAAPGGLPVTLPPRPRVPASNQEFRVTRVDGPRGFTGEWIRRCMYTHTSQRSSHPRDVPSMWGHSSELITKLRARCDPKDARFPAFYLTHNPLSQSYTIWQVPLGIIENDT